tara:strand:+ start:75 stop:293 length:219 start_codon:yes stop_codon:yes gene_type:complete
MIADKQSYNIVCKICNKEYNILANQADVLDWKEGHKYIQDALAYLSSAERELFISQTCDTCWTQMYGIDDDE